MTRIVLVDDNESILSALQRYLSTYPSFEVVGTTNTATTACDLIEIIQPDLVITDLEMPGVNGFELTQQLRQAHPDLTIIMLTASETPAHRVKALAAGADAFVGKSSPLSNLVSTIETLTGYSVHT